MPLTGCSIFGTEKPPATEVVVKRQDVPDALLVLPDLPAIPPKPRTQQQVARWANAMEEWAGVCQGRIYAIRDWSDGAPAE